MLCKGDSFTLFVCIVQVGFTESSLYALKRKRLESLIFNFSKKIEVIFWPSLSTGVWRLWYIPF